MPHTIETFVNFICETGRERRCTLSEFVRRVCRWVGSYLSVAEIVAAVVRSCGVKVHVVDGVEWLVGIEPLPIID